MATVSKNYLKRQSDEKDKAEAEAEAEPSEVSNTISVELVTISLFESGIDFTAGPLVPTSKFPRGLASFVMRRSGGPVGFGDIHKVSNGKTCGFPKGPVNYKPGQSLCPVGEKM